MGQILIFYLKNPEEISFAGFEFEIPIKKLQILKTYATPLIEKKKSISDTKFKPLEVDLVEATEVAHSSTHSSRIKAIWYLCRS